MGMKNNKIIAAGVIALVLLIGLSVWALGAQKAAAPQNDAVSDASQTSELSQLDETPAPTETTASVTITYNDGGFDKDSYTVTSGSSVTLVNNSSRTLEFASDEHPTHRENTELNLSALKAGEKLTFAPAKSGTWSIHDHLDASKTATLVVQ
jgi:plastocyanin